MARQADEGIKGLGSRRSCWLAAGGALAGAIAIAGASIGMIKATDSTVRFAAVSAAHMNEVTEATAQVLAATRAAGQRDDAMLAEDPAAPTRRAIAGLDHLSVDSPPQQHRIKTLAGLLRAREAFIGLLPKPGDPQAAVDPLRDGQGKRLADAIRVLADEIGTEERRRLDEHRVEEQQTGQADLHALTAVSLGGVLLLGGSLACLLAATAARARAAAGERQRLLDALDLAAVMLRDLNGTIRFWSQGCQILYGWTAEEAIERSVHGLLRTIFPAPPEDVEAALLRDGEWSGDLRQRRRDGIEVIVAVRKVLRRDAAGRPLAVIEVMENITDVSALRQAEAALRESQARLQSVVDTAADGIVVAMADGRIMSVNAAALRMFGYARDDELVGQDVGLLMPMSEAARHGRYIAAHRAGAPPRIIGVPGRELLARRRDGAEFPIDLSVSSFGAGATRYLTGIMRDITGRKQTESGLRESEARLRLVQQVSGIANADWTGTDPLAWVSEEYRRLYGLPAGQERVTVDEWLALVHEDDRERVAGQMRDLAEKGGALAAQFRIHRGDRSARWVAIRAEAFPADDRLSNRVISAHHDITEIVAAREALTARKEELEQLVAARTMAWAMAEAQFHAIFDAQFEFIALLAPDGTVLEANRTFLEAGGLTRDAVVGRSLWETGWWSPDEREALHAEIDAAAGGKLVRRESEIRGTGGRRIWIDFSLKPVHDTQSNAVMWLIAEGRDLTEKHEMANRLAQAQKLQALGQLAGGIAHDFNNILQTVSGAAALIERRPDDGEKARRLAQITLGAVARGTSITQRLLAFARRGNLHLETLVVEDLLNSICEVLAHTLDAAIAVRVDVAPELPPLIADRGQMETVLVNLATNARDAMPDGGMLTLSADAERIVAGTAHPAGLAPGDYIRIIVADNGAGMDAVTLVRATEPFFTTKPPNQGTGLGLAMAKGFAEQSGGGLAIDSVPGAGTTVTLWLRQALGDIVHKRADDVPSCIASAAARLLLVDDDDLVRETLTAQLEDLGLAVLVARDGAEALALLEAGEVVDAMVSDMSMPGINGVETI